MSVYNDEFSRLLGNVTWSQKETADRLGIHPTVIWKYQHNKAQPSLTVLRLFSLLSGSPLTLPGEDRITLNDKARYLTPWEEEIGAVLRPMDTETRTLLIRAIAALVGALGTRKVPRRRKGASDHPPDPVPSSDQLVKLFAGDIMAGATATPAAGASVPGAGRPRRSNAAASAAGPLRKPGAPVRIDTEAEDRDGPG